MANPEHVEIVKQGVEAIAEWRKDHSQQRLELAEAELTGAQLSGADLRWADLTSADLSRANLVGTSLNQATLTYVKLQGANLSQANLHTATLRYGKLSEVEAVDANLGQTDLSGAVLDHANLRSSDLSMANLSNADLTDACLAHANLDKTDLSEANLRHASFREANLRRARLIRANLFAADISRAYLSDTDFEQALCGWTMWVDVDLSKTKNLETTRHACSSTVSINTVFRSQGKISDLFLRGCGVPKDFVEHISSFNPSVNDLYNCFIVFNHQDKEFAEQLHKELQARGVRCWLDEQATGVHGSKSFDRGVQLWDKTILCASKHSLSHSTIENTIRSAAAGEQSLRLERGISTQALLPIDLDGYLASADWSSPIRDEVQSRVLCDFNGWREKSSKFQQAIDKLIRALASEEVPIGISVEASRSADSLIDLRDEPAAVQDNSATMDSDSLSVDPQVAVVDNEASDRAEPVDTVDGTPKPIEDDPLPKLRNLMGKPCGLLSGFSRLIGNDGGKSMWYNHKGEKVLNYHIRQRTIGDTLEWETPTVDDEHVSTYVNFVFAGSFGAISKPQTEGFEFAANGVKQLDFDLTRDETAWQSEDKRLTLIYMPRWRSKRDSAGFFYVSVSGELLTSGQPCRFAVRSKGSGSTRWFGLQPVTDPEQLQVEDA